MSWTRRDVLNASLSALLAGVVPRAFARDSTAANDFVDLRRHVGMFTARGGTIGWLVNPSGAVVVDSQFPDTAAQCVAGLEERSALPIDALINSHHHGDHTGGNGVFREAARHIVAHARVPEHQRRVAAGAAEPPTVADVTFQDEWMLDVGDERVRAKHYGPAHTNGDVTIFFERANVVHMGDLVFNRSMPFIDRGGGASTRGWIDLLEAVASNHESDTIFVFGHGRPEFGVTGRVADVLVQRDFLSAVLERAERAVAEGKSREEATALDRLAGFPDHVAISERLNLAAALGAAYDEVAEEG